MADYQTMLELAKGHGYASFTPLQENAFQSEAVYDDEQDLFVVGATSSGKTLIPQMIYEEALCRAEENGDEYPKMLFVVPYRSLAAQKAGEMQAFYGKRDLKIVQSTGEFRQDDGAVQRGEVHIGVIISEKVYKYEARDPDFLSQYDFLVLDEIGLLNDSERGIRLDFVLAWAAMQRAQTGRPRIIALGTPFFDWSAYIESYHFHEIRQDDRPVQLKKIAVTLADKGISEVSGDCPFLSRVRWVKQHELRMLAETYGTPGTACEHLREGEMCPMETPCRSNPGLMCDLTHRPCPNQIYFVPEKSLNLFRSTLLKICREHLRLGHQVLVFINNRQEVKNLCQFLYRELKDELPVPPPAEECRRAILEPYGLESDDVFGVLEYEDATAIEDEFYQAFASGIGFHSAAMPNELRTYVEQKLLESREMKIVCSTETLAFGVNSSVDVVVIADLYKHEATSVRPLSLNEYQNYAGRAGRLRAGKTAADVNGYVYTLIKKKQVPAWNAMWEHAEEPKRLHSLFHADRNQKMPFFVLNLMSTEPEDSMTEEDIFHMVSSLPMDEKFSETELRRKIRDSLCYLQDQKLAGKVRLRAMGRRRAEAGTKEERYCLTGLGGNLRGLIIGLDDYGMLKAALEEYVNGIFADADKTTFLYRLLCTKHAETGLNAIFSNSETRMDKMKMLAYIEAHTTDGGHKQWRGADEKKLTILAAMLAWTEGESPKTLYRQFGVHYALISKLAEQIAYLIEIAQAILPDRLQEIYEEKEAMYRRMSVDPEVFIIAREEKLDEIHELFCSVFFGVNPTVTNKLMGYLDGLGEPGADDLREMLSLHNINPISARKLRRIVVRYKFFEDPPRVDPGNIEMRNNLQHQRWRYKTDIDAMGPYISGFFAEKFGRVYTD